MSTGPGGKKPGTGKRDGKDVVSKEEKKNRRGWHLKCKREKEYLLKFSSNE